MVEGNTDAGAETSVIVLTCLVIVSRHEEYMNNWNVGKSTAWVPEAAAV
jgi:hypothetical protein